METRFVYVHRKKIWKVKSKPISPCGGLPLATPSVGYQTTKIIVFFYHITLIIFGPQIYSKMELPDATKKKIIFIKVIVYKLLLWKERTRIHHLSKLSELQHRIMPLKTHFWTTLAYNFFYNTTPKYTLHFKGHVKHNDKWWNGYSSIKKKI